MYVTDNKRTNIKPNIGPAYKLFISVFLKYIVINIKIDNTAIATETPNKNTNMILILKVI